MQYKIIIEESHLSYIYSDQPSTNQEKYSCNSLISETFILKKNVTYYTSFFGKPMKNKAAKTKNQ